MKTFSCGDVVPGCTKTFEAETEDDILERVSAHAAEDHGMAQVPAHVALAVRSKIRDAVQR